MVDLYKQYYDIDITEENGKEYVWSYIPHLFYTPFYVYQYATSFAASLKLYELVKEDSKNIVKHIGLLKSGGNDYPVDQVKKAGVDLTTKEPFMAVVNRLNSLLDELDDNESNDDESDDDDDENKNSKGKGKGKSNSKGKNDNIELDF